MSRYFIAFRVVFFSLWVTLGPLLSPLLHFKPHTGTVGQIEEKTKQGQAIS